ncbi:juvenile hormone acid O-methyltransferase-like [Lutzomyia longipalpis]|uniref:juvenile hormone acid O-methyltransferase-like n=1 Tax=Lutzomyia longipalpis TaxID=7200 RepID=UPI002484226E|nr:juvenile hormone acid O-methyltransferase-like [Lutzomyia longipalpis]
MSFDNAKAYLEGNTYTMSYTKVLMENYGGWIEWCEDGRDSLLDIGSGPGSAIKEAVYPLLPANFSKCVLSDISPLMVEMQKKVFSGLSGVSCEILDIGNEISEKQLHRIGTFDHITSFFCLMWVADQQKAMDNIYKLLKPGGDCFLVIMADSLIIDVLLSVCIKPRWRDCLAGWENFYVYPYTQIDNAKAKALQFMKNAGFVETKAELIRKPFDFSTDKEMEKFLRGFPTKFSRDVTENEKEEIFQERLKYMDKYVVGNFRDNEGRIHKPNVDLVLYGKKNKFSAASRTQRA